MIWLLLYYAHAGPWGRPLAHTIHPKAGESSIVQPSVLGDLKIVNSHTNVGCRHAQASLRKIKQALPSQIRFNELKLVRARLV